MDGDGKSGIIVKLKEEGYAPVKIFDMQLAFHKEFDFEVVNGSSLSELLKRTGELNTFFIEIQTGGDFVFSKQFEFQLREFLKNKKYEEEDRFTLFLNQKYPVQFKVEVI